MRLDLLWGDIRFAFRIFKRSPSVALTVIATLAVALGLVLPRAESGGGGTIGGAQNRLVPWKRDLLHNSRAGHPGWLRCSSLE